MLTPWLKSENLVLGCGNPLLGDDGFGPEVIGHLESVLKGDKAVFLLDVGTSIRDILFDLLLSERRPKRLVIIDTAYQEGKAPGDITEIPIERIEPAKIVDYSLHQFPTTNLLKEIQDSTGVEVRVLVVQAADIPDSVRPGLSPALQAAVPLMGQTVLRLLADPPKPAPPTQEGD